MFRNTADFFSVLQSFGLDCPIALPSLTASVLSWQSWDSQEWESHLGWQEGRWVRMPSPHLPPIPAAVVGGTPSFDFNSWWLFRSSMASRAFHSQSIDGMERQQVGRGGLWWVVVLVVVMVGLPASANRWVGGPALACSRPRRPWRGHQQHRPCRLTDSSQSSWQVPGGRFHLFHLFPHYHLAELPRVIKGCQAKAQSDGLLKLLKQPRCCVEGWLLIQLLAGNFENSCQCLMIPPIDITV